MDYCLWVRERAQLSAGEVVAVHGDGEGRGRGVGEVGVAGYSGLGRRVVGIEVKGVEFFDEVSRECGLA